METRFEAAVPLATKAQAYFLGQTLPNSAIQISNGNATYFDQGSNTLRLNGVNNSGICIKNIEATGKHITGVLARFSTFTSSTVTMSEGAESAGTGQYTVAFGDIPNGGTSCASLALSNSSSVSYRCNVVFEGTLTSSQPQGYISNVNTTRLTSEALVVINGLNLSDGKTPPTVMIGENQVSNLLSYDDPSKIEFYVSPNMAGWSGYIFVNNGSNTYQGPYVRSATLLAPKLLLPSGSKTGRVFMQTWGGVDGVDSNGCPVLSGPQIDDFEISAPVTLTSYPDKEGTEVDMSNLDVSGATKNLYIVFDNNNNGAIDSGDLYALIRNVNVAYGTKNTPANMAAFNVGGSTAGTAQGCAVDISGTAYCWGSGTNGQLGGGNSNSSAAPVQISAMSGVSAIATGATHSCAIDGGKAKCWGDNTWGERGDGTNNSSNTPDTAVANLPGRWTSITAGTDFSCGINDGAAYCWGINSKGELGDDSGMQSNIPVPVTGLDKNVEAISGSGDHACAIKSGALWCWGVNSNGQLGDGSNKSYQLSPVEVSGMSEGVTAVATSYINTCAVWHGVAFCWGDNTYGQIGDGTYNSSNVPVAVTGLDGGSITSIDVGGMHVCAILNGTQIVCWGDNTYGQLGDGTYNSSPVPVISGAGLLPPGNGINGIEKVDLAYDFSCATYAGSYYCWGNRGSDGYFGNNIHGGTSRIPESGGSWGTSLSSSHITLSKTVTVTCP